MNPVTEVEAKTQIIPIITENQNNVVALLYVASQSAVSILQRQVEPGILPLV